MHSTELSAAQIAVLPGLDDWRYLLGGLHATYRAGNFAEAAALVVAIAAAAEAAEHHPDVDLRYPDRVLVTLTTHATGGVTDLDVELARTISALAAGVGASSEPLVSSALEIAIDTMDESRIRPFWEAVLGYRSQEPFLVDPVRRHPQIWFQQMDEPRKQRNRIHLDLTVPPEVAEARVAAALAAGGVLVSDARARAFWVLADAEGNEVCVCTWQDRPASAT